MKKCDHLWYYDTIPEQVSWWLKQLSVAEFDFYDPCLVCKQVRKFTANREGKRIYEKENQN